MDSNTKYYIKPIDSTEKVKILNIIKNEKSTVMIWEANSKITSKFKIKDLHLEEEYFLDAIDLGIDMKDNNFTKEVLVKIITSTYQFFTNSKLNSDNGQYLISFNNSFFQGIQRSNCRLEIDKHNRIELHIGEDHYYGHDISAGGVSFFASEKEKSKFIKGDTLKLFKIIFNDFEYIIPEAKVMAIIKTDEKHPAKTFKLAIQFVNLPTKIDEQLYKQINTEMKASAVRSKI